MSDRTNSSQDLEAALLNRIHFLESEPAAWEKREAELLAEIRALEVEKEVAKSDLQALKLDHEHCAKDFAGLNGYAEELREGKKEDEATIAELIEKMTEAIQRAKAGEIAVEESAKLKLEKGGIDSMIKIVVQTRLPFLIQASNLVPEAMSRLPRDITNHYVKEGNAAAHAGCGTADAQLFLGRHIPPSLQEGMDIIFKDLYRMTPWEFVALSEKEKVAIDCEATIRALHVQNNSMDRPITQRQQALDHIDIIRSKARKMSCMDFESDTDVDRRLGKVKELVAEIVEWDGMNTFPGGSPFEKKGEGSRKTSSRYKY